MTRFNKLKVWVVLLACLMGGAVSALPGDVWDAHAPGKGDVWRVLGNGNMIPGSDVVYSLGDPTHGLKGIYVPSTISHFHVVLTSVQICAMYGTAVDLLPGPGVGKCWVLNGPVHIRNTYGTSATASGGAVVIQYHGSATAATGTMANTQVNISSVSNENILLPVAATPTISAGVTTTDVGALEITNGTGAFTKTSSTTTMGIDFNYSTN